MDFVWAAVYPFRGKRWYLRLPLMTAVLLLSIVGIVIGFGYVIAIIRRIAEDDYDLPPFRLYATEGIYTITSVVGHSTAASLIAVPIDMSLSFRFRPQGGAERNIIMLIDLLVVLPVALPFFIGLIRYALTNDPYTLFDVKKNSQIVWRNKWHVLQSLVHAMVFALGAGCAVVALYNLPGSPGQMLQSPIGIIVFFIMLIGLPVCGAGYLLGQLARRMDLGEDKVKRKNDVLKHT